MLQFVPFLPHLPLEEVSVARALREGGYATWHVGKWHLGGGAHEPQHHGFEVNIAGGSSGMPNCGYFSPYRLPNCLHKRGHHIRRRVLQSDPAYAAMVENLDMNIGRLLAALEAAGQAEDTLVIFTSDNGGLAVAEGAPTCNRPLPTTGRSARRPFTAFTAGM
jgi:arylsulfatase A-like enzyme